MKIGTPANYYVRVGSDAWTEPEDEAPKYAGTYEVDLNQLLTVTFVDDVAHFGPPWSDAALPPEDEELTDPGQVRLATLLSGRYVVTPHDALAGRTERTQRPVVFYVTTAEFAELRADLEDLGDEAGSVHSGLRRDDLREHPVLRLLEERVLMEPWLSAPDAELIGR